MRQLKSGWNCEGSMTSLDGRLAVDQKKDTHTSWFTCFISHLGIMWENHPIWRTYFSNVLVQPPTKSLRVKITWGLFGYQNPPKPTFPEVFMVNNMVSRWSKPFCFMDKKPFLGLIFLSDSGEVWSRWISDSGYGSMMFMTDAWEWYTYTRGGGFNCFF